MPKTSQNPLNRSNEMDDRDPTAEELKAIGDLTIPPLTAPMDSSRDEDDEDAPATVASPTLSDMNARMLELMEAMQKQQTSSGNNDQIATGLQMIAEAMQGFRSAQLEGATTIADMQRRTVHPENKFVPNISAFNPRGDKMFPRPALKCTMLLPWPVDNGESLTREEIELLNLLQPGVYTIRRADRTPIKLQVTIDKKLDSEEPSVLLIHHDTAFNNDNHRLMPYDWIRQMVMGHSELKALGVLIPTMEEEEALIAALKFNDGTVATRQTVVSVGE